MLFDDWPLPVEASNSVKVLEFKSRLLWEAGSFWSQDGFCRKRLKVLLEHNTYTFFLLFPNIVLMNKHFF